MGQSGSVRMAAALLLLLATVVFAIGISAERSLGSETTEPRSAENLAATGAEEPAEEGGEGHDEDESAEEVSGAVEPAAAAETAGEGEEEYADEAAPHDEANEASETILGFNPDSTGVIAAAAAVSLALAAALWFWGTPIILTAALAFGLLYAALDLREVAHQVGEARGGLAAIALLAAALHGGVAVLVGLALTRRDAPFGTPALR
jgi:hypothetical protein